MKRFFVLVSAIAAALSMLLGSGPAAANPWESYVGLTYAGVKERNSRVQIASRVGSYLPTEECIVTGSRTTSFLDSSGNSRGTLLVDLNCNDPKSVGGDGKDHAGNSLASPEGRKMADLKERAKSLSANYAKALEANTAPGCEKYFDSCKRICKESGSCSAELTSYLGL